MNQSKFEIVSFNNRNGSSSWRVVGWLHGERVRKNFKTRAEAAAEKATLEVRAAQTEQGMRTVATTLTAAEVREAETVFHRLRGRPCPLSVSALPAVIARGHLGFTPEDLREVA